MNTEKLPVILAIDDVRSVRASFRYFLQDYDFEVIEAENGKAGLELFKRYKPDLVLLDLLMPEMDGLSVLEQITNISPQTPVIVISGTKAIQDVVEAIRLGASDYLLKPIEDLTVLLHSVNNALERARLRRENHLYREHLEEQVAKVTSQIEQTNKNLMEEVATRKQAELSLKSSEQKFRMIFEFMPIALVLTTNDGQIIDCNQCLCKTFNTSAHQLKSSNVMHLYDPPQARQKIIEKLSKDGKVLREKIQFKKTDGSTFSACMSMSRILHEGKDSILAALCELPNS